MALYRITCIIKHSTHERISAIGCINTATNSNTRFEEDGAIKRIEDGTDQFFVEDSRGIRAYVQVEERHGRKFLITIRDGIKDDNLLYLPECPPVTRPTPPSGRTVYATGSHCVWPRR